MADINSGKVARFETGGTVTITYGATDYVVKNIKPGTLSFADGGRERLTPFDRGVIGTTIIGDQRQSKIDLVCRIAAGAMETATEIHALSVKDDTSAGTPQMFTLKVFIPDAGNAATGNTLTWANCFFDKPVDIKTMTDFDEMALSIVSNTDRATVAQI